MISWQYLQALLVSFIVRLTLLSANARNVTYHATSDHSIKEKVNICPEGYYCDHSKKQYTCGSIDLFCPEGSDKPTKVFKGHYTKGGDVTTRTHEVLCEPGYFW